MSIKLSVGIVTRNRPDSLERTLLSLSKQNPQPYEVIVSDDSQDEKMIEENKKVVEKYGYTYLTGQVKGLYANRNFVAKHCSGTHIRSMDDDHEFPDENHMRACIAAIEAEPDVIWTMGEYHPWDETRPIPVTRIPGQLHPKGYSYTPKDLTTYYGISCGASLYPRAVFDNNILNVEAYKFGMMFLEYGVRLFKKGYKIKHLNTTYILHHAEKNDVSISAPDIANGARLFCMFMLSFQHIPTAKNKLLTLSEMAKGLATKTFSPKLIRESYANFKKYKNI
jgi:glycosyltransferase involved in cell wall biosynthesis